MDENVLRGHRPRMKPQFVYLLTSAQLLVMVIALPYYITMAMVVAGSSS